MEASGDPNSQVPGSMVYLTPTSDCGNPTAGWNTSDDEVFAMTPARPSYGRQHYENLFNFTYGVCLDGGC